MARAALGTINHKLLTIEAARARGLTVSGVVYSQVLPNSDETSETASPGIVSRISGVPTLGRIPHLPDDPSSGNHSEGYLNMTAIVGGA